LPAAIALLGRGVIIDAGSTGPAPWHGLDVVRIDPASLDDPAPVVERLHAAWSHRQPVIVALAVDPATFRVPQSITGEPWTHTTLTEPWFDRLHFLVWANNYDARGTEPVQPVWWWARKAARLLGDSTVIDSSFDTQQRWRDGDVCLPDGSAVWIDGGPRQPWDAGALGAAVIHAESVDAGRPLIQPAPVAPKADLAADQLAAVSHLSGPARIIAPAGSGKTRVLTERLRHLAVDRRYERDGVIAVAYNKQAQQEMERRTVDFGPVVRTLNSLGLWVLAQHRGSSPPVVDERESRRLVEAQLPGRWARRANTDPIGPYLEGLAAIRLGLRDPAEVEESRDDVDGLTELLPRFRAAMFEQGVVDFDEQIYSAIEVLLADGQFRRRMQRSCRHLLVDEFQDLTPAHVLLLRLLSLPRLDVFGVGDDDQCIYGHAGADPGFLIDYTRLFPGAAAHALEVNYRCPVEVVTAASALLGYNDRRIDKVIVAGEHNDTAAGALRVIEHLPEFGAQAAVGIVQQWLGEPAVEPRSIALLSRVNSLLLAPHVAMRDAGIPVRSVVSVDVLNRTGLRAALAYVRIAANPDGFAPRDVIEILKRPSRGLPPWFADRISRRRHWTVESIADLAGQVPGKDESKVRELAQDLSLVVLAGRAESTRRILEVVRDDVGLGAAMSLLDRTGGGQGSSHLDDIEGLLGVADLHPDPGTFEEWLRNHLARPDHHDAGDQRDGVTVSTIHRVKGREWDRVLVFGVVDGVVPHRLADDTEEERRVLHVGITRGRRRIVVLADGSRRSPFLDELTGTAPRRPAPRATTPPRLDPAAGPKPAARSRRPATAAPLDGRAADAEAALRAWRTKRAKADRVPAYVVLNDRYLRGIAIANPQSARELAACDGIGPTKLERYADEILHVLSGL
jgi:DNA helicase-2/ATP-dependent DNA helicase PcrA